MPSTRRTWSKRVSLSRMAFHEWDHAHEETHFSILLILLIYLASTEDIVIGHTNHSMAFPGDENYNHGFYG